MYIILKYLSCLYLFCYFHTIDLDDNIYCEVLQYNKPVNIDQYNKRHPAIYS
jgi:hypothetical protein